MVVVEAEPVPGAGAQVGAEVGVEPVLVVELEAEVGAEPREGGPEEEQC